MTNAIGAVFLSVTLVMVLGALAGAGIIAAVVAALWHRQTDSTPAAIQYVVAVLGLAVLVVSAWGVVLIAPPAPQAGALFALVTFVPLAVGVGYGRWRADAGWLVEFAAATTGWSVGFAPGLGTAVVLLDVLRDVLEPAAEPASPLPYVAAVVGGIAVTVILAAVAARIRPYLES